MKPFLVPQQQQQQQLPKTHKIANKRDEMEKVKVQILKT
jgi:hypothetical protein